MSRRVPVPSMIGVYDRSCPVSRRRILDLFRAMSEYDRRVSWMPADALRPTGLWGYSFAVVSATAIERFRSVASQRLTVIVDANDDVGDDAMYVVAPDHRRSKGLRSVLLPTLTPASDIVLADATGRPTVAWLDPSPCSRIPAVVERSRSILAALRKLRPDVCILADRRLYPDTDVHIDGRMSDIDRMRAFAMADIALFVGASCAHDDLGVCETLSVGKALPVCVGMSIDALSRYAVCLDADAGECARSIDRLLTLLARPDGLSYRRRIMSGWAYVQRERSLTPMRVYSAWLSLIEFYHDITKVRYVPVA